MAALRCELKVWLPAADGWQTRLCRAALQSYCSMYAHAAPLSCATPNSARCCPCFSSFWQDLPPSSVSQSLVSAAKASHACNLYAYCIMLLMQLLATTMYFMLGVCSWLCRLPCTCHAAFVLLSNAANATSLPQPVIHDITVPIPLIFSTCKI